MNINYPILLRLENKQIVVVGGGKVAERKVGGLLGTGAHVTVISPDATEELKRLASQGKIDWQQKAFSEEHIRNAFMIFAATNDKKINQLVKSKAAPGQLVTIADDPESSDFHIPSQFHRGRLSIAISTGGASPTLAGKIKQQLEQEFDESYEEFLDFLFMARQRILKEVKDPIIKRKLLTAIVSKEFLSSVDREADFSRLLKEMK